MVEMGFSLIGRYLTNPEQIIGEIKDGNAWAIVKDAQKGVIVCAALYGLVMGLYVGGFQPLINALKMPLILLLSLYISLPPIYITDLLVGNKIKLGQTAALVLIGMDVTAFVLLAFLPLFLFFIITCGPHTQSVYLFVVILNIGICGLAGVFGLISILKNYRIFYEKKGGTASIIVGCGIIGFVTPQIAWIFRPFFHSYEGFIRPPQGNFYVMLGNVMNNEPYLASTVFGLFFLFGLITALIWAVKVSSHADRAQYPPQKEV